MLEIGNDVRDVLNPDRHLQPDHERSKAHRRIGQRQSVAHPNQVRRDSRLDLLLGGQLLVRRRRRMNDERLRVA